MIAHRKGSEIWLLMHIFFCHFLHRVPIRASLDEASPDLGGETLLENLLIHHTTLSEPLDGQGVEHDQKV